MEEKLHKNYNGIYLTIEEVNILKKYNININNYKNLKKLMYDIESYLNESYEEDLDLVSQSLAEFNYYHNTIK